jgi:hypothetical protein
VEATSGAQALPSCHTGSHFRGMERSKHLTPSAPAAEGDQRQYVTCVCVLASQEVLLARNFTSAVNVCLKAQSSCPAVVLACQQCVHIPRRCLSQHSCLSLAEVLCLHAVANICCIQSHVVDIKGELDSAAHVRWFLVCAKSIRAS